MQKLQTFNILDVPENVVAKVAEIVNMATKMSIKVEWIDKVAENVFSKVADTMDKVTKISIKVWWIDKVLEAIDAKRDHFTLLQEGHLLRIRLEELQQKTDDVGLLLADWM